MKKINLKYFICLICSSLLLYATLNVFFFYEIVLNNIESKDIIIILLPGIFAILSLGIFYWITEKDFELIQSSEVDENKENDKLETKKNNRKKYVYFWIIILLYIFIFGIVSFGEITLKEKSLETALKALGVTASVSLSQEELLEIQKEYNISVTTQDYIDWGISMALSSLTFIPAFFTFHLFFIKRKHFKFKIIKIVFKVLGILLISGAVIISIYYFVDIPEFKYTYEITDEGITFHGYSDFRDYNDSNSMVVPEKILGKKVVDIGVYPYLYNDEIFVPSTFPKEKISFVYASYCNIHMYGEPIEWYEENDIIYNVEGNEILYVNTENLYISENVTAIDPALIVFTNFLKSIEVSPSNEKFFSHDDVFYHTFNLIQESGDKILATEGYVPQIKGGQDIIIPDYMSGEVLYLVGFQYKNIVIPATLNRYIEFGNCNYISEYKVQEGNIYYETFEGSLYEKGLRKIVAICDYSEKEVMKLPKELEDFSEVCLENIIYQVYSNKELKIIIDENNPNFVIEDNLVYNKDKTKLIMPVSYMESIMINKNVEEISEALLESYMNLELSPDNPYFIVDEFGEIQKR